MQYGLSAPQTEKLHNREGPYGSEHGASLGSSSSPRPRLVLGGPGRRRGVRGNGGGGGGRREVCDGAMGLGYEGAVSLRGRRQVRSESARLCSFGLGL